MSVLKEKRTVSKAEYVNTANQIYVETVGFLTRLSARYSRLIAEGTAQLAGEVMDHTEKANKIYPSDEQRKAQRKAHLLEALASLSALDEAEHERPHKRSSVLLYLVILFAAAFLLLLMSYFMQQRANQEAMDKLDRMAQSLGELIDREDTLLRNILESDRKRK